MRGRPAGAASRGAGGNRQVQIYHFPQSSSSFLPGATVCEGDAWPSSHPLHCASPPPVPCCRPALPEGRVPPPPPLPLPAAPQPEPHSSAQGQRSRAVGEARVGAGVPCRLDRNAHLEGATAERAGRPMHEQGQAAAATQPPARTMLLPPAAATRAAAAPVLLVLVHADRAVAVRGVVRAQRGVAAAAAGRAGRHLAAAQVDIVAVLRGERGGGKQGIRGWGLPRCTRWRRQRHRGRA